MAMRMVDTMREPRRGQPNVETRLQKQKLCQMIEASQGGCYAGNNFVEQFEQPAVRPVKSRRR